MCHTVIHLIQIHIWFCNFRFTRHITRYWYDESPTNDQPEVVYSGSLRNKRGWYLWGNAPVSIHGEGVQKGPKQSLLISLNRTISLTRTQDSEKAILDAYGNVPDVWPSMWVHVLLPFKICFLKRDIHTETCINVVNIPYQVWLSSSDVLYQNETFQTWLATTFEPRNVQSWYKQSRIFFF